MAGKTFSVGELTDVISSLLPLYGMSSAFLFGSYARGEADETSDIDVLLYRGDGFQPLGVFGFAEDLRRTTGKQVDAYEISELDEGPFRDAVLLEAVEL